MSQMQNIPLHQASLAPRRKHSSSHSISVQHVTTEIAAMLQMTAIVSRALAIERDFPCAERRMPAWTLCGSMFVC
ncbi:hypothetical protein MRX96_010773 [Rhipicephalus microplus]